MDTVQFIAAKPAGGFVFIEVRSLAGQRTHEAVHCKVKLGVIPFNRMKELVHRYLRGQFFADFAYKSLLRAFPFFNLATGPFPVVFPFPIAPLGGKNLVPLTYDCRNYFYLFHDANIRLLLESAKEYTYI